MNSTEKSISENLICYHCGDECPDDKIHIDDKIFCCNGCKSVFSILNNNDMCTYYSISDAPGITKKDENKRNYDFLDDTDIKTKFIDFNDEKISKAIFSIPQMHCSSCIWILENLNRLDNDILASQVNFLQKSLSVTYNNNSSLKKIVTILDSIGYEPLLNLEEKRDSKNNKEFRKQYYKIGIAGFCFGNIMLLSFPEYLSISPQDSHGLNTLFNYLNIILSIPVFFYSGSEYLISAYKSLRNKIVNIDVPIALGIIVLFLRSLVEIVFFSNAGYLDSMTGLIFFLLIGKLFQTKTYDALNFERNYKSYFPLGITIKKNDGETTIPVEKIVVGNRLIIRNGELIPVDAVLIKGNGTIDYSFVTGEALPIKKEQGEVIYAGGKQTGGAIEVESIKEISQSYLTRLWNNKIFSKQKEMNSISLANIVSKYFTFIILGLAIFSSGIWMLYNTNTALNVFTAILIVACPCALALSTPFTSGNALRIMGRNNFYLRNVDLIEELTKVTDIVFDKTGTLTVSGKANINYEGIELTPKKKHLIKSAVRNSTHPLSKMIFDYLDGDYVITGKFNEIAGEGIFAEINGSTIKLGSLIHVDKEKFEFSRESSIVHCSINEEYIGKFTIHNFYREKLTDLAQELKEKYYIHVLSGDNKSELKNLKKFFGNDSKYLFGQSPQDKLDYIAALQNTGKKVLMMGDGLNDAGALRQSDIGISISEDKSNFSPSCDGILEAKSFDLFTKFLNFAAYSKKIIIASFIISFVYNFFGLYFAISGNLTPILAAILMPISSISIVIFTTTGTNLYAKRRGLI
ncbi:MAG: heavy metal translocating P-type ATPase metal-binding domain-containing protein [Melioribacteraceae bacterium]